jgi:hypothetical protein
VPTHDDLPHTITLGQASALPVLAESGTILVMGPGAIRAVCQRAKGRCPRLQLNVTVNTDRALDRLTDDYRRCGSAAAMYYCSCECPPSVRAAELR